MLDTTKGRWRTRSQYIPTRESNRKSAISRCYTARHHVCYESSIKIYAEQELNINSSKKLKQLKISSSITTRLRSKDIFTKVLLRLRFEEL